MDAADVPGQTKRGFREATSGDLVLYVYTDTEDVDRGPATSNQCVVIDRAILMHAHKQIDRGDEHLTKFLKDRKRLRKAKRFFIFRRMGHMMWFPTKAWRPGV